MSRIKTREVTDKLFAFVAEFNELFLTSKEKALLVVLLFTMPDVEGLQDLETLRDLNEYYTRALLYEFDVNKRDFTFMSKFKNVSQTHFFIISFLVCEFNSFLNQIS